MSDLIYEASVYSRKVSYRNFKGDQVDTELFFALDPLQLLQVISTFEPKKSKSGNPALRNQPGEITQEEQLKFIRRLVIQAAGTPSDDGEVWTPFEDFSDSLAGKAFLTKLTSSDGDRKEFAEKVILEPFKAFVRYAEADPSNTPKDIQMFHTQLAQLENVFKTPEPSEESIEDRRARLAAEMAALEEAPNPRPAPPADES